MIAFNLRNCDENPDGPRHIKRFRLVNKEFSDVGAEYLLREIHLTFQTKSFERLRTISQHPCYTRYVMRLHYEPDAFGTPRKSEQGLLEDSLDTHFNCNRKPPTKSRGNQSSFLKQLFDSEPEEIKAAARHAIRGNYKAYKAASFDHMKIRHQTDAYNSGLVVRAIAQLPHLTEITLNFEGGVVPRTKAFNNAYRDTFILPRGDNGNRYPYGVMQLYSVLCGVALAGIKLKTLKCGKIDWKFLQMDEKRTDTIKRALKHLEYLRIMFYVGEGYLHAAKLESEIRDCGLFLANYGMCGLLSAAKDLKTLSLSIHQSGGSELEYMVGTTTWACLRVLELDRIDSTEKTLIDLVTRHAGTLRELELNNVLLSQGCWTSALPGMRNVVRLEEFRAVGRWASRYPLLYKWIVDTSKNSQGLQESTLGRPYKLGMAVDRYVREGGECPLLDRDKYPLRAGYWSL